jgi:hypothetical protein
MLAVQSLVVLGLAVSTRLWLTVTLVVIGGAMQFGIMTHCNTVVQAVVDDDHRGRVMSIYVLCWGGSLPLGGLLLGTVWHLVGPVIALGASGLVALSIAAYTLRASVPLARPVPGRPLGSRLRGSHQVEDVLGVLVVRVALEVGQLGEDVGRGVVEPRRQPRLGHRLADEPHLGHPPPGLPVHPLRGLGRTLGQLGLRAPPLVEQGGLHVPRAGVRAQREQQRGRRLGPAGVGELGGRGGADALADDDRLQPVPWNSFAIDRPPTRTGTAGWTRPSPAAGRRCRRRRRSRRWW